MLRVFDFGKIARKPCVMALVLLIQVPCLVHAQPPRNALPAIFEYQVKGKKVSVASDKLFAFEQAARWKFTDKEPPKEMFLLAWASPSVFLSSPAKGYPPRGLIVLEVRGDHATLRLSDDYGEKQSQRELSGDELKRVREFVETKNIDRLPRLEASRMVRGEERVVLSGRTYVYLHISSQSGSRVWINNPPSEGDTEYPPDDPHWDYSRLVDLFLKLDSDAAKK